MNKCKFDFVEYCTIWLNGYCLVAGASATAFLATVRVAATVDDDDAKGRVIVHSALYMLSGEINRFVYDAVASSLRIE